MPLDWGHYYLLLLTPMPCLVVLSPCPGPSTAWQLEAEESGLYFILGKEGQMAGEMDLLSALADDPSLVPITHTVAHNHL